MSDVAGETLDLAEKTWKTVFFVLKNILRFADQLYKAYEKSGYKKQRDAAKKMRDETDDILRGFSYEGVKTWGIEMKDIIYGAGFDKDTQTKLLNLVDEAELKAENEKNARSFTDDLDEFLKDPNLSEAEKQEAQHIKSLYEKRLGTSQEKKEDFFVYQVSFSYDREKTEGLLLALSNLASLNKKDIALIAPENGNPYLHAYDRETYEWALKTSKELSKSRGIGFICYGRDDFYSLAQHTGRDCVKYDGLSDYDMRLLQKMCHEEGIRASCDFERYEGRKNPETKQNFTDVCSIVILKEDQERFERAASQVLLRTHGFGKKQNPQRAAALSELSKAETQMGINPKGDVFFLLDMDREETDPVHFIIISNSGLREMEGTKEINEIHRADIVKNEMTGRFDDKAQRMLESFSEKPLFLTQDEAGRFKFSVSSPSITQGIRKEAALRYRRSPSLSDQDFELSSAEESLAAFFSESEMFSGVSSFGSAAGSIGGQISEYQKQALLLCQKEYPSRPDIRKKNAERISRECRILRENQSGVSSHFTEISKTLKPEVISHKKILEMDLSTGDVDLDERRQKAIYAYDLAERPKEAAEYQNSLDAENQKIAQKAALAKTANASRQAAFKQKTPDYFNSELKKRMPAKRKEEDKKFQERAAAGKSARNKTNSEIQAEIMADLEVEDVYDVLRFGAAPVLSHTGAAADLVRKNEDFELSMLTQEGFNVDLDGIIRDEIKNAKDAMKEKSQQR